MGVAVLLWPQQMPPLWPAVQMVITKKKAREKDDAETEGEVRLREIVTRINEQATKLTIIKSAAEKSCSPPVALGCKPASCLY